MMIEGFCIDGKNTARFSSKRAKDAGLCKLPMYGVMIVCVAVARVGVIFSPAPRAMIV